MTATTQDRGTPHRGAELFVAPLAAGVRIPAGTIVCANAGGFAVPAAADAALVVLGMADNAADNSGGADGGTTVRIRRGRMFRWANNPADPVTQASLGRPCYVSDNQTVARTHATNTRPLAGTVLDIDVDGVWVL
ncbi:hypothetical protein [Chitiniphilus eburneus]|uniref:hypothetical protein n=1 Tax=Chitiniphilus eburneus TaxID=2571148 RepID=UPI0035CF33CC